MQKEFNFLELFNKFISESKSGRRLKQDGAKIKITTILRYQVVRDELIRFTSKCAFPLRIKSIQKMSSRHLKSEYNYWRRFYKNYSDYLYSKGCYDNYVGAHFKVIRTFFNYLNRKKAIYTGEIHKEFYIRIENIPIVVLEKYQLDYLKSDLAFEESLPDYLRRAKDILVVGCYVGLRFSDLMRLTKHDLVKTPEATYLQVRSIKTGVYTKIKLFDDIKTIFSKYKNQKYLLPHLTNNRLNLNLKELCEKAGWVYEVGKVRAIRGSAKKMLKSGKTYRFCDLVTTHTMRRTAITTLLTFGMPETMVRKLSGHSANSREFYRYIEYAQISIDKELDRINKLNKQNQINE